MGEDMDAMREALASHRAYGADHQSKQREKGRKQYA